MTVVDQSHQVHDLVGGVADKSQQVHDLVGSVEIVKRRITVLLFEYYSRCNKNEQKQY